jgi:hypothetical protein
MTDRNTPRPPPLPPLCEPLRAAMLPLCEPLRAANNKHTSSMQIPTRSNDRSQHTSAAAFAAPVRAASSCRQTKGMQRSTRTTQNMQRSFNSPRRSPCVSLRAASNRMHRTCTRRSDRKAHLGRRLCRLCASGCLCSFELVLQRVVVCLGNGSSRKLCLGLPNRTEQSRHSTVRSKLGPRERRARTTVAVLSCAEYSPHTEAYA